MVLPVLTVGILVILRIFLMRYVIPFAQSFLLILIFFKALEGMAVINYFFCQCFFDLYLFFIFGYHLSILSYFFGFFSCNYTVDLYINCRTKGESVVF